MANELLPDNPFEPVIGGGFAAPVSFHVGEVGTTRGGMTVWDEYVVAMLPAMVARARTDNPDDWAGVVKVTTSLADALIRERENRRIGHVAE